MERGLVSLDCENLGIEKWLVSNPDATQAAFDTACATGESLNASPLDEAAEISKDCLVLAAHWGNDLPADRNDPWLAEVLATTRPEDREEVRALIDAHWTEEDEA
jgi:hypothetical protein